MPELTLVEAIRDGMDDAMAKDETVMLLGEDVGVDGGIFRASDGLLDTYGADRVVDTPLAETGIVGSSIGLAIGGMRPIAELQFSGFSYQAFHHVESHLARYRKRTQGKVTLPVVIRFPYGAGVRALEHHSESKEVYYTHTPGIKVVVPSGPRKGYGFLRASIEDPDPVIFFEPKELYRAFREDVERGVDVELPEIGPAEIVREGDDLTMVAWGAMLRRTIDAAEQLAERTGKEAEVVELNTLSPLDSDTICDSVRRTGRCVIVHEAHRTYGPAGEIIARINEEALLHLEAPVQRVTGYDVTVPLFAREQEYMPNAERILKAAEECVAFGANGA